MRFVPEETKPKMSSVSFLGLAALGMRSMSHLNSIPKPASSIVFGIVNTIVGITRSTCWIPRLFRLLTFGITPEKIQFQRLQYHPTQCHLFCVTCTTGNPVYANEASTLIHDQKNPDCYQFLFQRTLMYPF